MDLKIAKYSNNIVPWIDLVWKRFKHITRYNLGEIFEELGNIFLQGPPEIDNGDFTNKPEYSNEA